MFYEWKYIITKMFHMNRILTNIKLKYGIKLISLRIIKCISTREKVQGFMANT